MPQQTEENTSANSTSSSSRRRTWMGLVTFFSGVLLGAFAFGGSDAEEAANSDPLARDSNAESAAKAQVWTCAMHPQIRQDEPGSCPICGMDLVPVEAADNADSIGDQGATVVLSERAKILAKVRTQEVVRRAKPRADLHLLGRLEANEAAQKTVTAWTAGRIERLHVNTRGEDIKAGQVVAKIYSPEVFAAHQDLITARRQVGRLSAGSPSSRLAAEAALEAARDRLRLIGVPERELERMEKEERPRRSVSIRSPYGGTVIERIATEGAYLATGGPLYRLAELDTLWVQLDAYESDLSQVSVGQPVELRIDALEGEVFEGEVTFIDPTVDPTRRTVRVRVEVENAKGRLKPGMFAEATLQAREDARRPLVVPATAPLFTGRRAVVFVETEVEGQTAYTARTVRLGPRSVDEYPVVAGLSEGERVVVQGAFALDADLQIKGGRSMMSSPDDTQAGPWDMVTELDDTDREQLRPVLSHYLEIQRALAADDLAAATAAATELSTSVDAVRLSSTEAAERTWSSLAEPLRGHATHVAKSADLEVARGGFETLSHALLQLLRSFGNLSDDSLRVAFCPMAMGSEGARWVQAEATIDNPYFGASMRTCGEVEEVLEVGAYMKMPATPGGGPPTPAMAGGHQH